MTLTKYQQLRAIRLPVLEAREHLLRQLELKFEEAGNERARELKRQGIDWGDMWHTREIRDPEMKRLVKGYLKYHAEHATLQIDISALMHEVYRYTGELHTSKSVAEIEEAHMENLRLNIARRHGNLSMHG